MDWSALYTEVARPVGLALLGLIGSAGLLAACSPRLFRRAVEWANRPIDSGRLLSIFDRQYDIDRFVMPYARLLGALAVASTAFLLFVLLR